MISAVCRYQDNKTCKHECHVACYCRYKYGDKEPNYPVPAIHKPFDKIHALNRGAWRWYWYLMGYQTNLI